MTARQKNWMTFGIVWGIILTVFGVLVFIGYRIIDRAFFHTKPELYDETKFEHALYEASAKDTDIIEEYRYGGSATFQLTMDTDRTRYDDNVFYLLYIR